MSNIIPKYCILAAPAGDSTATQSFGILGNSSGTIEWAVAPVDQGSDSPWDVTVSAEGILTVKVKDGSPPTDADEKKSVVYQVTATVSSVAIIAYVAIVPQIFANTPNMLVYGQDSQLYVVGQGGNGAFHIVGPVFHGSMFDEESPVPQFMNDYAGADKNVCANFSVANLNTLGPSTSFIQCVVVNLASSLVTKQ
ncbi:hypothetical protein L6R52_28550 [Myxococcota bacterium]|nr:hypothetical protein [Myxococcota bacterium]